MNKKYKVTIENIKGEKELFIFDSSRDRMQGIHIATMCGCNHYRKGQNDD